MVPLACYCHECLRTRGYVQTMDVAIDLAAGTVSAENESSEAAKRQRALRCSLSKARRAAHRVSVLMLLARGLLLDAAADCSVVQAAALSLLPASLAAKLLNEPSDAIVEACNFFQGAFAIVPDCDSSFSATLCGEQTLNPHVEEERLRKCMTPHEGDANLWEAVSGMQQPDWYLTSSNADAEAPLLARSLAVRLLKCAQHQLGPELHAVALFVAALRACGHLTRFVVNFAVRCSYLPVLQAHGQRSWHGRY
jgi:hypothetical protein